MDSKSLEKRLSSVKDTAEDIQILSRWCIQHRNHHHSIVQAWSRAVRKAKVGHRLTLFYVCNDIVQNARRKKCLDLVQYFGTAIKESVPLVRDEKIRKKIRRIFNIWEERGIYDAKLIAEFNEIIENVGTVNATENEIVLSTFQLVQLVEGIRNLISLEKTSECLLADLRSQEYLLTEEEINKLQNTVKERGTSRGRLEEFEDSVLGLECYIASLQKEIEERTRVVTLLEQAEIFYETQRGEAKLVASAYKHFSTQVKTLKTKLTERNESLPEPSPVPTPTSDAPSPQGSDCVEILEDDVAPLLPTSNTATQPGLDSFLNSKKIASLALEAMKELKDSDKKPTLDDAPQISFYHSSPSVQLNDSHTSKKACSPSPPSYLHRERRSSSSSRSYESKRRRESTSRERDLDREQKEFELQLSKITAMSKSGIDTSMALDPSYKEPTPMSAKELLDTFGRSYSTSSLASTPTQTSSLTVPRVVAPPPLPPPLGRPHTPAPLLHSLPGILPIPLPPSKAPSQPDYAASLPQSLPYQPQPPRSPPQKRTFPPLPPSYPPLPPATTTTQREGPVPWPVEAPSATWNRPPLPPPPPPPPPEEETPPGGSYLPPDWDVFDEDEDEGEEEDNRNWGELPGAEELQALGEEPAPSSDTSSEGAKSLFSSICPPPPPPIPPLFPEGSASGSNLVSIEPDLSETRPFDYPCYDYRSLAQESTPSMASLFPGTDVDMRIKKSGTRHGPGATGDSGSDMDISDSDVSVKEDDESSRKSKKKESSQLPRKSSKSNSLTEEPASSISEDDKEDGAVSPTRTHKPVSFSLLRPRTIIPLTGKEDEEEEEEKRKKKLSFPLLTREPKEEKSEKPQEPSLTEAALGEISRTLKTLREKARASEESKKVSSPVDDGDKQSPEVKSVSEHSETSENPAAPEEEEDESKKNGAQVIQSFISSAREESYKVSSYLEESYKEPFISHHSPEGDKEEILEGRPIVPLYGTNSSFRGSWDWRSDDQHPYGHPHGRSSRGPNFGYRGSPFNGNRRRGYFGPRGGPRGFNSGRGNGHFDLPYNRGFRRNMSRRGGLMW